MLRKNTDLVITRENPFENDCLSREKNIKILSSLIDTINQPFVISVEAPWGFGKTTFIQMWQAYLENDNHICLYFNAWKNDFSDDPLIAFISELSSQIEKNKIEVSNHPQLQESITKLKKYGGRVAKNILPLLITGLTRGILSRETIEGISDFITDREITELLVKYSQEQIKLHEENKKSIDNFIEELNNFVQLLKENEKYKFPLVVFVDELDRCRPDFAIEVLERIKHLFSVNNILFVLAIDRDQLSNSLKTIYGYKMKTNGYLRRFIDLSYLIPNPSRKDFCHYLDHRFEISSWSGKRENNFSDFIKSVSIFSEMFNLSLREIEQCFTEFFLITRTSSYNLELVLLPFLTTLKNWKLEAYEKLKSRNTGIDETLSILGNPTAKDEESYWIKQTIHAHLINYFFNSDGEKFSHLNDVLKSDQDFEYFIRHYAPITSSFFETKDIKRIISYLEMISDFKI